MRIPLSLLLSVHIVLPQEIRIEVMRSEWLVGLWAMWALQPSGLVLGSWTGARRCLRTFLLSSQRCSWRRDLNCSSLSLVIG